MSQFDICFIYLHNAWPRILLVIGLKLCGKKSVLELNEYPYATGGDKFTRIKLVNLYLRTITKRILFPLADGFVVISERLENVVKQYSPKAKVIKIPILTDQPLEINSVDILKIKANPYLFHAGSLSEQKDGIVEVLEAFVIAHNVIRNKYDKLLKFKITNKETRSQTWQKIQKIIDKNHLQDCIEVTGFLSKDELQFEEQSALALVINKPKSFQNLYNFPTKLSTYLAAGRPVIVASEDLELNKYLYHKKNAYVTKPNDSNAMAKAIIEIYELSESLSCMILNARKTVESNFYYIRHSDNLSVFLRNL